MIDAWSIGVSIQLNDEILAQIDAVYGRFNRVQDAVDAINTALTQTGGIMTPLVSQATAMASAFSSAARAARAIQQAMADTNIPAGPGGAGGGGYAFSPAARQAGPGGPALLPEGGGGLPALIPGGSYYSGDDGSSPGYYRNPYYGTGGTPSGPDSAPNDYVPNWGPGGQPQDEPFNRPGPVPLYPGAGGAGGFDAFQAYFGAAMAAGIGVELFGKPFEAAASVDQKIALLQAQNLTAAQAQSGYDLASKMRQQTQFQTLSIDTLMGMELSAFTQTKDWTTALQLLPAMANAGTVYQATGNSTGLSDMMNLMRSADLAGLLNDKDASGNVDPARVQHFFDLLPRIDIATGHSLTSNEILRLYQNMGAAAMNLDDEGVIKTILLAQSLGQQKTGTGLQQMFKELVGGKMSIANEKFLESIGLLDPSKVIPGSAHGGYVQMQAGAIKDEAAFMADPVTWIATEYEQLYENAKTPAGKQALMHALIASAGTSQGARVMVEAAMQQNMIDRQYGSVQNIPNSAALALALSQTPQGSAQAAANATNALFVTLSNDTMDKFQAMFKGLTAVENAATNAAQHHPQLAADAYIDAGYQISRGILKTGMFGKFASGPVADLLGKLFEPLLYVQLAEHEWNWKNPSPAPWSPEGQQAFKNDWYLLTGQPDKIVSTLTDQTAAINSQTRQIVAAIKGQHVPAMPVQPNGANPQQQPPAPGQALPNHW